MYIMKEEIREICSELNRGRIAVFEATEQLNDLHLKQTKYIIYDLFHEIEHGDAEHREWLKTKMIEFYDGYAK